MGYFPCGVVLVVLAAVLLCGCAGGGSNAASAPPLETGPDLVRGAVEQAVQISGGALAEGREVTMTADIALTGPTAHFSIGPKKPAGMRLQVVAGSKGQELGEAPGHSGVIDEYGMLAGDYYAQLAVADLDGDGTYEVLASIGNGEDALRTLVYRYQSGAAEPFVKVGAIDGTAQVTVEEGGVLYVPDAETRLRLEGDALVPAALDEMG